MKRVDLAPDELPDASTERTPLELPDRQSHYVRDVLRMEPGDSIELFDGEGRILEGRLQQVDERGVVCWIERDRRVERAESSCDIVLFQAIPKGKRWKWVLEKTTELGVDHVVPVETERTVVEIPPDRTDAKLERWHRIVRAAARQCGRTFAPSIARPRPFSEAVDGRFDDEATIESFVPHPDGGPHLADALRTALEARDGGETHLDLWIGPEGGFAPAEIERLDDRGASIVDLGPRILRAETAAVAAVTLMQSLAGDLG